jgi:hypothetical protein
MCTRLFTPACATPTRTGICILRHVHSQTLTCARGGSVHLQMASTTGEPQTVVLSVLDSMFIPKAWTLSLGAVVLAAAAVMAVRLWRSAQRPILKIDLKFIAYVNILPVAQSLCTILIVRAL